MPIAVVFDVDGTLVDSVDVHARAWQDALRDFGHNVTFEQARSQIGKGGDQLLPVFLSEKELADHGDELERHRSDILKSNYLREIKGFPKVRQLMQHLLEGGHRIALASSAKGQELEYYKRVADIHDLIETETSSDDAAKSKPNPDIFQAALKRLGHLAPDDVIIVGDTPYDAEAAAKAGIRCIGLRSGGWSTEDLLKAGCVAVYQDPAELLDQYATSALATAQLCAEHGN